MTRIVAIAMLAGIGLCGCRSTPREPLPASRRLRLPPTARPVVHVTQHRLIPYPGLEVAYVTGASRECFYYRGTYYCFHEQEWFHSARLTGPWSYVPMKYVPADLFRVRGHRPQGAVEEPQPPPPGLPSDSEES